MFFAAEDDDVLFGLSRIFSISLLDHRLHALIARDFSFGKLWGYDRLDLLGHHQGAVTHPLLDLHLLFLLDVLEFHLIDIDLLTFLGFGTLSRINDVGQDQTRRIIELAVPAPCHEHVTLLRVPPSMHILGLLADPYLSGYLTEAWLIIKLMQQILIDAGIGTELAEGGFAHRNIISILTLSLHTFKLFLGVGDGGCGLKVGLCIGTRGRRIHQLLILQRGLVF